MPFPWEDQLRCCETLENAEAALTAVMKAKPDSTKGNYLLSAAISTTMGPSVKLDLKEIANLG